jgi:hypothetical protein
VAQLVHVKNRNAPAFQDGGDVVLPRAIGPGQTDEFLNGSPPNACRFLR